MSRDSSAGSAWMQDAGLWRGALRRLTKTCKPPITRCKPYLRHTACSVPGQIKTSMSQSFVTFVFLGVGAAAAVLMPDLPPAVLPYMPSVALVLGAMALWVGAGLVQRGLARLWTQAFAKPRPVIVVDGSNVMHWHEDVPSVRTLTLVLADLTARGFAPHVFFDANVGYKLWGRATDCRDLAIQLDLNPAQVTIAPSRTPADPLLIGYAIKAGQRVVSNDRFMDWRAAFPQIRDKGFLVPGSVRGGQVELRFVAVA